MLTTKIYSLFSLFSIKHEFCDRIQSLFEVHLQLNYLVQSNDSHYIIVLLDDVVYYLRYDGMGQV